MDSAVASTVDAMSASTERLVRTASHLTDEQAREPSLLPGWTRGHVLTHLARNADALGNLVAWARTGVESPMYASREQRAADIEAGAGRDARTLVTDVTDSAERLMNAMAELSTEQWATTIAWGRHGLIAPADRVPVLRREEVEIHHVDLDLDYTLAHMPIDFVEDMLGRTADDLSRRDDIAGFVLVTAADGRRWQVGAGGSEISGTSPALLGWLLGRTDGVGVHSESPLPELGPWR